MGSAISSSKAHNKDQMTQKIEKAR